MSFLLDLFKITEFKNVPATLHKFLIFDYKIYYSIEDSTKMHRYLEVNVKIDDQVVANADFVANCGEGHCNNVNVDIDYQRKGMATALYVFAEFMLECILEDYWVNDPKQTESAKKLWSQNDRPFGNNE